MDYYRRIEKDLNENNMTLEELIANQTFLECIDYDNERAKSDYFIHFESNRELELLERGLF